MTQHVVTDTGLLCLHILWVFVIHLIQGNNVIIYKLTVVQLSKEMSGFLSKQMAHYIIQKYRHGA
jgi:hypothetical protein